MKSFTLTMMGTAPMLVHNAQLSDPLNKWAKEMKKVSAKRTKTEDDHLEMSRLEFYGGMYYDADLGPVIPAMNKALRLPVLSERAYVASVVSAECSMGPYSSKSLTLTTPADSGVWVRTGPDTAAIRAFATDAAREFGFATVGDITVGGISTDVASGRTTRTWYVAVSS